MAIIRLLDISGIFWPVWRAKEAAGRPVGEAANEVVEFLRIQAASKDVDHVVACCDSGRTFRHDVALEYRAVDPEYRGYKGHRPEKDDAMMAALRRVSTALERDGVPVFQVAGFEADDVIATIAKWALDNGHDVEIVSEDKDLCQLVLDADPEDASLPTVCVIRRDGRRLKRADVIERLGVPPEHVASFLAMTGDTGDAVLGIAGIGGTIAARLLYGWADQGGFHASPFRSVLDMVTAATDDQAQVEANEAKLALAREQKVRPLPKFPKPQFTDSTRKALIQGYRSYEISHRLTALRFDVPLDFGMVTAPREPPKIVAEEAHLAALLATAKKRTEDDERETIARAKETLAESQETPMSTPVTEAEFVETKPAEPPAVLEAPPLQNEEKKPQTSAIVKVADRPFDQQLEARNLSEAQWLAETLAASRKIKDANDPNVVLLKLTVGRSLGMKLYQCVRLHLMEGQITMPTSEVLARVKSSPLCEYIRKVSGDDKSCTWITKRRGEPEQSNTFTIEMARTAMLGGIKNPGEDFDPKSAWTKWRQDMLSARTVMPLMRQEYPEIYNGYSTEELGYDSRSEAS